MYFNFAILMILLLLVQFSLSHSDSHPPKSIARLVTAHWLRKRALLVVDVARIILLQINPH